jgi:ubiquitin C-terminal hydrolase
MSVTVYNVPPHSASPVRPKLPVEPQNSLNGSTSKSCHTSPRQLRLNVPSVLPSQDLSLGQPSSNVASSRSNVGLADVRRKPAVIGQRRRISTPTSTPHQMAPPSRQIYMEVGLENLGNTCFMNSSLQCLLHIEPLVSYFLATDISKALNEASPMKGLLAASFAQLVKDIFNASAGSSIAPMAFQKVVSHETKAIRK